MRTLIILLLIAFVGCQSKPAAYFDYGKVENGRYTNSYFNLEMSVPEDWEVFDTAGHYIGSMEKLRPKGLLMSPTLVTLKRNPTDTVFGNTKVKLYRARLKIAAEVRERYPDDPRTGEEELKRAKQNLVNSGSAVEFPIGITPVQVGNREFYMMEAKSLKYDEPFERYYARMEKGFVLLISLAYTDEKDKAAMLDIVNGIKFNGQ